MSDHDDQDLDPRYIVPGLSRGIAMLRLFNVERTELSVADLAAGVGVTRSSAYRLIYTLEKEGLIARTVDERRYRLTASVLGLGFDYLNSQNVGDVARPALDQLGQHTLLSTYVAILDGPDVVYVAHSPAPTSLVSGLRIGTRQPSWLTASGRVLLASLPDENILSRVVGAPEDGLGLDPIAQAQEDRVRGYVLHRSHLDPTMASCAAPVRDASGEVSAAITAIGSASRVLGDESVPDLVASVLTAAAEVSKALGYRRAG